MLYESLIRSTEVTILEQKMPLSIKGLYGDNVIWINQLIPTNAEKACILAEELGHYQTSSGNILDQSTLSNRKQEQRARHWGYENLIPLEKIIEAYRASLKGRNEIAEYIGVTEEFLQAAINRYAEKYGIYVIHENYVVYFDPLGVAEFFE